MEEDPELVGIQEGPAIIACLTAVKKEDAYMDSGAVQQSNRNTHNQRTVRVGRLAGRPPQVTRTGTWISNRNNTDIDRISS